MLIILVLLQTTTDHQLSQMIHIQYLNTHEFPCTEPELINTFISEQVPN